MSNMIVLDVQWSGTAKITISDYPNVKDNVKQRWKLVYIKYHYFIGFSRNSGYFWHSNFLNVNNNYNWCGQTSKNNYFLCSLIFNNNDFCHCVWLNVINNQFGVSYVKDNGLRSDRIENVKDNHFCVKWYQRGIFTFSNQERQK